VCSFGVYPLIIRCMCVLSVYICSLCVYVFCQNMFFRCAFAGSECTYVFSSCISVRFVYMFFVRFFFVGMSSSGVHLQVLNAHMCSLHISVRTLISMLFLGV